jgi:SAM-dependent methyltransferase
MSEVQVSAAHYDDWVVYNKKARWASYWHQITEVLGIGARSCLEIGTGSGAVKRTLTGLGIEVTSVDIDDDLKPDLVGDVRALPCETDSFDVALASQVLEHIPWTEVPEALSELSRVSRSHVVVSLPQAGVNLGLALGVHALNFFNDRGVSLHIGTPWRHRFDGQHYWEVGARGSGRRAVRALFARHFAVEREYTVAEMPYHRFYVLANR